MLHEVVLKFMVQVVKHLIISYVFPNFAQNSEPNEARGLRNVILGFPENLVDAGKLQKDKNDIDNPVEGLTA
jgi:hypothetical protein